MITTESALFGCAEPARRRGCTVVLRPGEIYTTNAFTAPGFRGRKIHTETLAHMLHAAKVDGYRDAYTQVSVLNRALRKTMDRLGWRLSGRVVRLRVRRSASFVGVAFSESRRPLGRPSFGRSTCLSTFSAAVAGQLVDEDEFARTLNLTSRSVCGLPQLSIALLA